MGIPYRWEIKTRAGSLAAGKSLSLTLHGSNGVTEPIILDHGEVTPAELAVGDVETDEDLGNLVTAEIVANLDSQEAWDIDFLRITRQLPPRSFWIAQDVGICTSAGCPLIRFERVGIYPDTRVSPPKVPNSDGINRRVIEIYARFGDYKAELTQALFRSRSGTLRLKRGAKIILAQSAVEGFGLSRSQSQISEQRKLSFSIGNSNFDVVALDGVTVRRLPAELLMELFGPSWWQVVLGNSAQP